MTPPTSNPSGAMSQERLEALAVEIGGMIDAGEPPESPISVWYSSLTTGEALHLVTQLLSLQRKNEELVRALTEIASFTQTDKLLWWQERAREAIRWGPPGYDNAPQGPATPARDWRAMIKAASE